MSFTAQALLTLMMLCEQAERYNDMARYASDLVNLTGQLTDEERNLFSVAFKNVVGQKRSAWRIISSIESKNNEKGEDSADARMLREEVEKELLEECDRVIRLINDKLLVKSDIGVEAKVFYLKMLGDYYRYQVEVTTGDKRDELAELSKKGYEGATKAAEELANTHPIKLGLALNFSVFYYEIMNDGNTASEIAKKAFDDAIAELDNLKEDSYKDSTLIMQLLRDNLTLWTSEQNDDETEPE